MLTVRVGKMKMARGHHCRGRILQFLLVLVPVVIFITLVLQKYSSPIKDEWRRAFPDSQASGEASKKPSKGEVCMKSDCPSDHFSFFILSGAANVVAPKICMQNQLVLGTALNNAGVGINVVIIDGKTGEVTKTDHFDMYSGDVKPLIELLQSIEHGSIVLMASFDEPSSKLSKDARDLIAELGSSAVQNLGFRDSWVFVGGKGASVKSNFEKHLKNDHQNNKYENWPELIELQGCIPKYLG